MLWWIFIARFYTSIDWALCLGCVYDIWWNFSSITFWRCGRYTYISLLIYVTRWLFLRIFRSCFNSFILDLVFIFLLNTLHCMLSSSFQSSLNHNWSLKIIPFILRYFLWGLSIVFRHYVLFAFIYYRNRRAFSFKTIIQTLAYNLIPSCTWSFKYLWTYICPWKILL